MYASDYKYINIYIYIYIEADAKQLAKERISDVEVNANI